jgi:hypothetical protein
VGQGDEFEAGLSTVTDSRHPERRHLDYVSRRWLLHVGSDVGLAATASPSSSATAMATTEATAPLAPSWVATSSAMLCREAWGARPARPGGTPQIPNRPLPRSLRRRLRPGDRDRGNAQRSRSRLCLGRSALLNLARQTRPAPVQTSTPTSPLGTSRVESRTWSLPKEDWSARVGPKRLHESPQSRQAADTRCQCGHGAVGMKWPNCERPIVSTE